jgi:hypothetical protein
MRGHTWDSDPDTPRNHALELIRNGNLTEALAIADALAREFPDLPDGHELRARIFEAQGQPASATVELRQLRALLGYLNAADDFDHEFIAWLDSDIERLAAITPGAASTSGPPC